MGSLSHSHVWARAHRLLLLTALRRGPLLGAGGPLALRRGLRLVRQCRQHPDWPWLRFRWSCSSRSSATTSATAGRQGRGRPDDLDTRARLAVVAAGFGGFLAHGGGARPVRDARGRRVRARGQGARDAARRSRARDPRDPVQRRGDRAPVEGRRTPPLDFTLRGRSRPPSASPSPSGRRSATGTGSATLRGLARAALVLLDAVHLVRRCSSIRVAMAPSCGILLFWLRTWGLSGRRWPLSASGCTRRRDRRLRTAMIVTRRTGPLGGAGS